MDGFSNIGFVGAHEILDTYQDSVGGIERAGGSSDARDGEHRAPNNVALEGLRPTKAWEIHPIMHIEFAPIPH